LWKPKADHDPNPVLIIGCDALISTDLKVRIHNNQGKVIRLSYRWTGRGNKFDWQKYGRIHVRFNRTATKLAEVSPLTVTLFHTLTGKDVILKTFTIKNPTKRYEVNFR
jgi:hypothetical protein